MLSPNVLLHRLEPLLLPLRCRRGVLPLTVSFLLREPPHHPPHQLVLEPPQETTHAGDDHPGLQFEYQHRLHHGFKEKYGHQRLRPLSDEDSHHTLPHCPHPWQINDHHRPVVVRHQDHLPQVSEGGHHLQGEPIDNECPGGDRLLLVRHKAPSLPLRSAPFLHYSVHRCIPFSNLHGTRMSHRGHREWGRLPSSSNT